MTEIWIGGRGGLERENTSGARGGSKIERKRGIRREEQLATMKETKWMLLGCALDNKSAAAFCEFLTACQRDEASKVENGAFACREFEYLEYVCGKRKIRWKVCQPVATECCCCDTSIYGGFLLIFSLDK